MSDIFNKRERVKTLPLFAYFFYTKTHAQTAKRGKDERERERRDESREDGDSHNCLERRRERAREGWIREICVMRSSTATVSFEIFCRVRMKCDWISNSCF